MLSSLPKHILQRSAVGLSTGFLLGFDLTRSTHHALTESVRSSTPSLPALASEALANAHFVRLPVTPRTRAFLRSPTQRATIRTLPLAYGRLSPPCRYQGFRRMQGPSRRCPPLRRPRRGEKETTALYRSETLTT